MCKNRLANRMQTPSNADDQPTGYPVPAFYADRHYSGYDHRPYDYSVMQPETLSDAFKKTRFAKSLTNLNPRNYTEAEKARYYTIEFANQALVSGDIAAPENRAVFWSGGYIPGHPLGYGLGRITAERWVAEQNAVIEARGEAHFATTELYHTVAMTEAGMPVLNPMWDDMTVAMATKQEITPTYILNFAKTARGEITMNVDDTDCDSFFRKNELQMLLDNPNITSVRVVRVDVATDKVIEHVYPNRETWLEDQRDQWAQSIATRFNLASEGKGKSAAADVLFERMAKAVEEEWSECEKRFYEVSLRNDKVKTAREMSRLNILAEPMWAMRKGL